MTEIMPEIIYCSYTPKQAERLKEYRNNPDNKELLCNIRKKYYNKMKTDEILIEKHRQRARDYYYKKKDLLLQKIL
jgi:hypothetical protein